MKKVSSVLVALLPVIYVAVIAGCFAVHINDAQLFSIFGIYALFGLLLPIIYSATSYKAAKKFMAISNLWFYAGNLALFLAEIVFWLIRFEQNRIAEQNGAMEGGLGLALLIIVYLPHWFTYLFTRIAGAIGCARSLTGMCSTGVQAFHTFLQLFPITDMISAVWVYRKLRTIPSDTIQT